MCRQHRSPLAEDEDEESRATVAEDRSMQAINPSFMACHQQDAAREGAVAFALDNHQDLPRTNLILDKHWWVRLVSGKHPLECCKQQRACCTNTYADATE